MSAGMMISVTYCPDVRLHRNKTQTGYITFSIRPIHSWQFYFSAKKDVSASTVSIMKQLHERHRSDQNNWSNCEEIPKEIYTINELNVICWDFCSCACSDQ